MFTLTEQRDEGLAHAPRAERVRLERLTHNLKVRVLGALPLVVEDGGVVDQHVQFTESLFDKSFSGINALLISYVQLNRYNLRPALQQRTRCFFTFLRVARAENRREASLSELACDFQTDPTVRTRDQSYPVSEFFHYDYFRCPYLSGFAQVAEGDRVS